VDVILAVVGCSGSFLGFRCGTEWTVVLQSMGCCFVVMVIRGWMISWIVQYFLCFYFVHSLFSSW